MLLSQGARVADAHSPEHLALGRALRSFRKERGWTLEELGHRMGAVNPRYVSSCERGEENMTWASLLRVCKALEITPRELMERYEGAPGA